VEDPRQGRQWIRSVAHVLAGDDGSPRDAKEAARAEVRPAAPGRVDGVADAGSRREAWREGDGSERRRYTEFVDDELKAPRGAPAATTTAQGGSRAPPGDCDCHHGSADRVVGGFHAGDKVRRSATA
jgi:hypothetical protein